MSRTILCFGDSNTHGTRALTQLGAFERMDRETRWPGQLGALLGSGWHVIEEGQPGRTTVHDDPIEGAHRNGLSVLPALLESHAPLDLVIVMLGTNDLKPRFAVEPIDIALSAERLIRLIAASVAGPGKRAPKVLLVAPVPITEAGVLAGIFAGGARKGRALGSLYAEVVARSGALFFDAGTVAGVDPVDGVHLTEAAHAAIAKGLNKVITEYFG